MEKGKTYFIWGKPITREEPEGEAILLVRSDGLSPTHFDGHTMEYWKVRFIRTMETSRRWVVDRDRIAVLD